MGFAASGQLIDRYPTFFLPEASGSDRRSVGGISCQLVANLTPALDQAIEVGQVSLDLHSQILIHWSRLALLADVTGMTSLATAICEALTVPGEHANFFAASGLV